MSKACILVHGAWHSNWCWGKILPSLSKLGFLRVLAPSLPGHDGVVSDFRKITLNTYVDNIVKLASTEDKVVLVGHSMAGVVISQVAEIIPDKISKLVYLSGFVPDSDGCLLDEEKKAKYPSVALEVKVDEEECSISISESKKIPDLFYGKCSEEDLYFAMSKLQKQPLLPFINNVSLTPANFGKVQKLYIECLQDKAIHIEDQRRMHSKIDCEIVSIDSDHSPFFSSTHELIKILGSTTEELI